MSDSDRIERLYQLARIARDDNNMVDAQKYYEEIKIECPDDWEAAFFSLYFRLSQCRIFQIQSAAKTMNDSLPTIFKLTLLKGNALQIQSAALVINRYTRVFADSLYKTSIDHFNEFFIIDKSGVDTLLEFGGRVGSIADLLNRLSNCSVLIDKIHENKNIRDKIVDNEKKAIEILVNITPIYSAFKMDTSLLNPTIDSFIEVIHGYEPNYTKPSPNTYIYSEDVRKCINLSKYVKKGSSSGGGCYIATSVYGSYDCPQVWTLRRYRDNNLSKTWYGRAFIRMYYFISPNLVKCFGGTEFFQRFWKKKLDRWVSNLNNNGLENTPYIDKER